MRVTDSVVVDAPLESVWAWWSDFGRPGESFRVTHGLLGVSRRRVVETGPDFVVFDEEVPFLPARLRLVRRRVTMEPGETPRLREQTEGAAAFDADWAFREHARGTLIVRSVDVGSLWTKLVPRGLARWLVGADLRHHARRCERDLARQR